MYSPLEVCGEVIELVRGDSTLRWPLEDESLDSIVTDPPYGISFMGRAWDDKGGPVAYQEWSKLWAMEAFRCLKPGGFLLAFGSTRMAHRMACAFEDVGFKIKDTIEWLYLTGFTKAGDIGKMFDRRAGAEREVVGKRNRDLNWRGVEEPDSERYADTRANLPSGSSQGHVSERPRMVPITVPSSPLAQQWDGWKTPNLKPAHEPIVVARKPFNGTYCDNIEQWGVGAFNMDGCRIRRGEGDRFDYGVDGDEGSPHINAYQPNRDRVAYVPNEFGRFPANVITIDEDEWYSPYFNVTPQELSKKASGAERHAGLEHPGAFTKHGTTLRKIENGTPKTGNFHPTVKPVALIRWLQRLVTPPGGTTASPFLGSGTDAVAAIAEGFSFWGMELSDDYWPIIEARVAHAQQIEAASLPTQARFTL